MAVAADTAQTEIRIGTGRRAYTLAVLTLAYAFAYIDRSIIGVLLPSIKQQFHASDRALAFLSGLAFSIFFIVLGIPVAAWADRGNRRNIVALAVTAWSAMTAACGMAGSFLILVAARIGVGAGEAGLTPTAHSLIADLFPPKARAFALSVYSSGVYVGVLVGMGLGGILAQHLGWQHTFMAVGLPGLLIALLILLTFREPPRGHSEPEIADTASAGNVLQVLAHLWRTRPARYAYIGITLCAMVTQTQSVWLPSFLTRTHHLPIGKVGVLLGLAAGIGGALGTLTGGRLSDALAARDPRWRLWIVTIAMAIAPLFIVSVLFVKSIAVVTAMVALGALVTAVHLAPTSATIQNLTPLRMRARAASVVIFLLNLLGLGIGPLIVGALSDWLRPTFGDDSLRYALLPVVLFSLLSAAAYFAGGRALKPAGAGR